MIPLFKKAESFEKVNYRHVSLLSHLSKGFERIILNQINEYIDRFFSNLPTEFCKNPTLPIKSPRKITVRVISLMLFPQTSQMDQRFQRMDANSRFSLWKEIATAVPQGLTLGALLFNTYINDMFLFVDKVSLDNYANDTKLYSIQHNPKSNLAILSYGFSFFIKMVSWELHDLKSK